MTVSSSSGILVFILVFVILTVLVISGCGEDFDRVPYEIIGPRSSVSGAQNNVTVVVIDRLYHNQISMENLEKTLKADFKKDTMAFVYVYSSQEAALSRESVLMETADPSTVSDHDASLIGIYTKNKAFELDDFKILLNGMNGGEPSD